MPAVERDMMMGIAMGSCITFLKKAGFPVSKIQAFERNATPAQIAQLYRTISMINSVYP